MRFDLENAGTWFYFDENEPEKGGVCVRVCTAEELERIEKASSKKKVEYKHGQRFEVKDVNDRKYDKLLWDFCIVDWDNVQDGDGNEMQCTAENKVVIMKKSLAFSRFVSDALETLQETTAAEAEADEKNSSRSQIG